MSTSTLSSSATREADRRIRALRPPKPDVDPYRVHGTTIDAERRPGGKEERALTIFLAGAECPFTCSFCDLWKWTIEGPTPAGAIPRQIEDVLNRLDAPHPHRLKLYNASNFFDTRAVPITDLPTIATLTAPFEGVTVESHASTIGPHVAAFANRLAGRLEVAIGLETVHPLAATELNKRLELGRFDRAARFLTEQGIDLRVFVLLGAPHIPFHESVAWTVRTVAYAAERGAAVVSIIPVRGGNGEVERLEALGAFTPPTLSQLEEALDACTGQASTVVTADLWDVDKIATCDRCRAVRLDRLARLNVTGRAEPRIACTACGAA